MNRTDLPRHEVVRTRSGALAMRSRVAGEVMHPGVGPLVEAEQLYIRQSRLADRLRGQVEAGSDASPSPLVVFDVGMGAGTNAALALAESERAPAGAARLRLVSFERDLDALEVALTHPAAFGWHGAAADGARELLRSGNHRTARSDWSLQGGDMLVALARGSWRADIVFWDPFSPAVDASPWTVAAFAAVRRVAGPRCTLFTYSASTAVRVALLLAGWAVGAGDGIGDKAATTAAAADPQDLTRPLDRRWLARLARPDAPLPADAPSDAAARVAAAPQFTATPTLGPGETAPARGWR